MWPRLVLYLSALVLVASAQQQQQQQQQMPQMQSAWPFARGSFTPIRVIQAQTPEQRQAIQNLVQELQHSAPELFSTIAQPGSQQLALALPQAVATGATPATPTSAAPLVQPQALAMSQQQRQPDSPPPAGVPMPSFAPVTPPPAATSPMERPVAPTPASAQATTPLSFALNALFPATNTPIHETSSGMLPFGLHFDASETEPSDFSVAESSSDGIEREASMSGRHQAPHGSHTQEGRHESSSFDEWAGLDNAAAKPAVTLVAIGLLLLGAVGTQL